MHVFLHKLISTAAHFRVQSDREIMTCAIAAVVISENTEASSGASSAFNAC